MDSLQDPSLLFSRVGADLNQNWKQPVGFHSEQPIPLEIKPSFSPLDTNLVPHFLDNDEEKKWTYLDKIKSFYHDPKYQETLRYFNPYEDLGNSIFINRAGVKIANIDAIFDLTQHRGGNIAESGNIGYDPLSRSRPQFTFLDLAGAPGGFSEYIFYRDHTAKGYGMSLKENRQSFDEDEALGWHPKMKELADLDRFNIYWGLDGTGNLFTNSRWLVKEMDGMKLDLIMADGAYSVLGKEKWQEILSLRIILNEIAITLLLLKDNGSFVCKIFDAFYPITQQLLYILSICFKKIWIFKPVSSRPGNSERYVICQYPLENLCQYYGNQLLNVNDQFLEDKFLVNLINQPLDINFLQYLKMTNQENLSRQIFYGEKVLHYFLREGSQDITKEDVNLLRLFLLWNIPATPEQHTTSSLLNFEDFQQSTVPSQEIREVAMKDVIDKLEKYYLQSIIPNNDIPVAELPPAPTVLGHEQLAEPIIQQRRVIKKFSVPQLKPPS